MSCGHSFCRLCLLQSTQLAPDGRSCPQCRRVIDDIRDPATHPVDLRLKNRVLLLENKERGAAAETGGDPDEDGEFAATASAGRSSRPDPEETATTKVVPLTLYEERRREHERLLQQLRARQQEQLPIFYGSSSAANYAVGASVQLHFFEPRYRILIRRSWEGERRFLCCAKRPSPGDAAVLVQVDVAKFLEDGRANVVGTAVGRVSIRRCWEEAGTEGLWYATVDEIVNRAEAARPEQYGDGQRRLQRVQFLLQEAIQTGAPMYNRGDIRGCFDLYYSVARTVVASDPRDGVGDDAARTRMLRPLAEVVAKYENGALRGATRTAVLDGAAWELRHCFDAILAMDARSTTSSGETLLRGSSPVIRGSFAELPVLQISSAAVPRVGDTVTLRLFEPRYRVHLMQEMESQQQRGQFLYCAEENPRTGSVAVLSRLESSYVEEEAARNTVWRHNL